MPSDVSTLPASHPRHAIGRHAPVATERCRDILGEVMRQTVISRLRLAHPVAGMAVDAPRAWAQGIGAPPGRDSEKAAPIAADSVADFVQALRFEPQAEVDRRVDGVRQQPDGADRLMLDLLPRAEIRLTELGAEIAPDAFDLTLARCRLQDIIERHAAYDKAKSRRVRPDRRCLLSTGEPEAFHIRLQITADRLSRDGWDVRCDADSKLTDLVELVRRDWFSVLVVASEHESVDWLAGTIRALRRASANKDLRVLLMSAPLVHNPEQLVRVGADAAAADVRQAALQADRLLTLLPPRPWAFEARG